MTRRPGSESQVLFALGRPLAPEALNGLDALVHLAWDWSSSEGNVPSASLRGSLSLIDACARHRVRVVLLSTFSAFSPEASVYGRDKNALERAAADVQGVSLRAGLVWGGEAEGMVRTVMRLGRLPLICPHLHPDPWMYHSHVDKLAASLIEAATGETQGPPVVLAASSEPVRLSAVAHSVSQRRRIHVPVPTRSLLRGARLASKAGLSLPFRPDSLSAVVNPTDSISPADAGMPFLPGFPGADAFLRWVTEQGAEPAVSGRRP